MMLNHVPSPSLEAPESQRLLLSKFQPIILTSSFNMGFFLTAPSNFLMPAGSPTIQLTSDTIYPEMASESIG